MKSKELKNDSLDNPIDLHIIFENCDYIEVPDEMLINLRFTIESMEFLDIRSIDFPILRADFVELILKLNGEYLDLFNRRDIVSISFNSDGKRLSVYAPYPSYLNSWLPNPFQINKKLKKDNFIYSCSKVNANDDVYSIVVYKHFSIEWFKNWIKEKLFKIKYIFR